MLQREFTEEQDMFRDAYRKFLATEIVVFDRYSPEKAVVIPPARLDHIL